MERRRFGCFGEAVQEGGGEQNKAQGDLSPVSRAGGGGPLAVQLAVVEMRNPLDGPRQSRNRCPQYSKKQLLLLPPQFLVLHGGFDSNTY